MSERLQKLLSAAGLMSRRAAEQAIAAGRVSVNGERAALGDRADPSIDRILLDGRPLPEPKEKLYLMLHKPRGYITSLHDEKGRRDIRSLLGGLESRVYPVGRLDMDSEGLLLLTNDGDFANRVMHPSFELKKTYDTWVAGEDPEAALPVLRASMEIDGYRIRPAEVTLRERFPGGALLAITIREGRNRQVRKMCAQAGLKVTRLLRVSEGGLQLGDLEPGCWRRLSAEELELIFSTQENGYI